MLLRVCSDGVVGVFMLNLHLLNSILSIASSESCLRKIGGIFFIIPFFGFAPILSILRMLLKSKSGSIIPVREDYY